MTAAFGAGDTISDKTYTAGADVNRTYTEAADQNGAVAPGYTEVRHGIGGL